jgi:ribosomal protein S18 acetylase RimI-like enzyme
VKPEPVKPESVKPEPVNPEPAESFEDTTPSPGFTVRTGSRRDLDELVRLCLAWPGAPAVSDPGLLRELLEQALSDDDATLYLAVSDESDPDRARRAVGFAHVTFQARPVRLGWRATIEELHVVPDAAHAEAPTAVESAMLEAIVRECRARGDVIALYLLTQPDLEPRRLEFYDGLGFRERGRDVLIWNGTLGQPD